jgi:hypothetical protein
MDDERVGPVIVGDDEMGELLLSGFVAAKPRRRLRARFRRSTRAAGGAGRRPNQPLWPMWAREPTR